MNPPDLSKMRGTALAVAAMFITLLLAQVELETPTRLSLLGIPLIIKRPDLLTTGLLIFSLYAMLRYVYYGMLAQPSPMRIRKHLMKGIPLRMPLQFDSIKYIENFSEEIDKYFPRFRTAKVTFHASTTSHHGENSQGYTTKIEPKMPAIVRVLCWIESIDFMMPVYINVVALILWIVMTCKNS